ncbi:MAG: hypothetical protein ACK559_41295, partial [bacterium]
MVSIPGAQRPWLRVRAGYPNRSRAGGARPPAAPGRGARRGGTAAVGRARPTDVSVRIDVDGLAQLDQLLEHDAQKVRRARVQLVQPPDGQRHGLVAGVQGVQ